MISLEKNSSKNPSKNNLPRIYNKAGNRRTKQYNKQIISDLRLISASENSRPKVLGILQSVKSTTPRMRDRPRCGKALPAPQPFGDRPIEREASGPREEEQHEDGEIGRSQLLRGEGIAAVDNQQRHAQHHDRRNQRQAEEGPDDDPGRADHLGEDRQHQRDTASEPDRVGESRRQIAEVTPLVDAVREQHQTEDDPCGEQQPRCRGVVMFGRKQKTVDSIHNASFFPHCYQIRYRTHRDAASEHRNRLRPRPRARRCVVPRHTATPPAAQKRQRKRIYKSSRGGTAPAKRPHGKPSQSGRTEAAAREQAPKKQRA